MTQISLVFLLAGIGVFSWGCQASAVPSGYSLRVSNATSEMVNDVAVTFHYDDGKRPSLGPSSVGVVGPGVSATDHYIRAPVPWRITIVWTTQGGVRLQKDVQVPNVADNFNGTLAITITENIAELRTERAHGE